MIKQLRPLNLPAIVFISSGLICTEEESNFSTNTDESDPWTKGFQVAIKVTD